MIVISKEQFMQKKFQTDFNSELKITKIIYFDENFVVNP